jgi:hypothetical protein
MPANEGACSWHAELHMLEYIFASEIYVFPTALSVWGLRLSDDQSYLSKALCSIGSREI